MGSRRVGHDWATSFHFSLSCIGEGDGNPLQCSCLENPRDGGAWWAAFSGVAQSRTWLKQLGCSSSSRVFCSIFTLLSCMCPSSRLLSPHPDSAACCPLSQGFPPRTWRTLDKLKERRNYYYPSGEPSSQQRPELGDKCLAAFLQEGKSEAFSAGLLSGHQQDHAPRPLWRPTGWYTLRWPSLLPWAALRSYSLLFLGNFPKSTACAQALVLDSVLGESKPTTLFPLPVRAVPTQMLKNLPAVLETWVQSRGWEDPLEKEMATHCSILAWRIPWTEEPGWLPSMGQEELDVAERLALSLFTFKPTPLLPLPVSPSPVQLPLFSLLLCPPLKVRSPPLPPFRQMVCPRPTTSEALEIPSLDYPWGARSPHQGRGGHQGQNGAKEERGDWTGLEVTQRGERSVCLTVLVLTVFPRRTFPPGPLVPGRKHPLTEGFSFLGCPRLLWVHSSPAHP